MGHELAGDPRLVAVGHHDSHAALAYFMSGFDSALVVIADGGGNTFAGSGNPEEWWTNQREQMSFYEAAGAKITLMDRDFFEPHEAGLAETIEPSRIIWVGIPTCTRHVQWHSLAHAPTLRLPAGHQFSSSTVAVCDRRS